MQGLSVRESTNGAMPRSVILFFFVFVYVYAHFGGGGTAKFGQIFDLLLVIIFSNENI